MNETTVNETTVTRALRGTSLGLALLAGLGASQGALAQQTVKMAVPTFLTGAGAPAFGVPGRNGAELVIDAINNGKLPAPYNTKGLAGRLIEPIVYDEAGGNTKQVTEFRNKVQKQNVDLFVGVTSSGTCQALAPVAEELEALTIFAVCGTPRIFEDLLPNPRYVFRTMAHATADNVAAAHYVNDVLKGKVKGYTGLNQNYAWGQDSYRDFSLALGILNGGIKGSDKPQFPKIFAGQYGTEISALMLGKDDLIHTSFWGGDLEAMIFQARGRGLFKRKTVLMTVAGTAIYRLGKKMPDGIVLGARGPYGIHAEGIDSPLNIWFRKNYEDRYSVLPTGPAYQYAQGVLAAKYAYDTAAKKKGSFPTKEEVIDALTGASFESLSTTVRLLLGKGHQAVTENAYGITKWDKEEGKATLTDIRSYQPECVMPPPGQKSVPWIKGGMQGAKCN